MSAIFEKVLEYVLSRIILILSKDIFDAIEDGIEKYKNKKATKKYDSIVDDNGMTKEERQNAAGKFLNS